MLNNPNLSVFFNDGKQSDYYLNIQESEWSVVPAYLQSNERIQEKSQQADDREFAKRYDSKDDDLGSRDIIRHEPELVWYPSEVNTSIRPGWFYHADEDDKVRSLEELLHIY